jgi:hypothetical protein
MEYQSGITQSINEEQLLHDALARWSGISVVDHFQVRDALDQRGTASLTSTEAVKLSTELGAGRLVRSEVSGFETRFGSTRRYTTYRPAESSSAEETIRLPNSLAGADSMFTLLAERLLLREGSPWNEHGSFRLVVASSQAGLRPR